MAILYITEYASLGTVNGAPTQFPSEPAVTTQTVAIGATSTQSSAFQNNTQWVKLESDVVSSVLFGTNPTALANASPRMGANESKLVYVGPSSGLKVATIVTTV